MSPTRVTPKTVLLLLFVLLAIGAGSAGMYLADRMYYAPLREQQRMVANLKSLVEQLTRDVRIAEVAVVSQSQEPLRTKFKFVEIDASGERIGEPKVFDIEGDEAYFDTLAIKFEETFKPLDDLALKKEDVANKLSNKSILFFRRVFSEKQKPEDGVPIDSFGQAPEPYRGKTPPSDFEKQLWKDFWELANNPKMAKERGVRAAHGQAVSMKLRKDQYYVLEQRLSGDLTIRPVDIPAVMRDR